MISLKDIPVLAGLAGSVITGSFYVHDIKRDVAELSRSFQQHQIEQSLGSTSDRLYDIRQRIKETPGDQNLKREEQELHERKERLKIQLEKIEGVTR